ncbi:CHAT domain-containing protein [Coleofasciculus sp. LEGE 07092]|uniref:CHAT domain-containing protein n=1 Tax=Coleofasciculus sp. LEGE 07092 TaxID=2777969 RepID=UPI001D1433E5|nr:CHAT domain-containing protein [Coleofasciculus sp. LEGE 07092]
MFLLVTTVVPVTAQTSPSLLLQGQTYYDAGRFADAAIAWAKAAQDYEQKGDRFKQAVSLNYLSLAYQDLGQWKDAEASINQSLTLLETQSNAGILAQALNTQGNLQLATGQPEAAFKTWQVAETAYKRADDEMGVLGSKINQAQALQSLGMFRRSQSLLEQVQQTLNTQPNSLVKATGLRSLGLVWQTVGDLEESQNALEESLAVARTLNSAPDISAALFSLGNTARGLGEMTLALQYYQQATETATSPLSQLEAQLNQFNLLIHLQQFSDAQLLLPSIQANLSPLPPSRDAIYTQVNLAASLMQLVQVQKANTAKLANNRDIAQLLAKAIQDSKTVKDIRAESFALGTLGKLYEQTQQLDDAKTLIQQALILSQRINATDISYQWQWQLARVLTQQGDMQEAIAANQKAVDIVRSLRGDLVAMNSDIRFSFQEEIEPIYRHLVNLLLKSPSQDNLKQARNVIESLQLAELENFFRTSCLEVKSEQIDTVIEKDDPTAAVIYPIILPDRLAVILSLPGEPLSQYTTPLSQTAVEEAVNQMQKTLHRVIPSKERLRVSQTIYNWLIQPVEAQLAEGNIKTLVFVLDGVLRNVPIAALYDGQQYLVEKYSIVLTPGLQLLEPRSLKNIQLQALTGGLSEARQGFSALPGVEQEVNDISKTIQSQVLFNETFTLAALEHQIKTLPVAIVHLATHGQFSSNPEDTFLLTWDERLSADTLSELLQVKEQRNAEPIELLVLSACQSATGDKRAALGLAGLAVRSGARSTVATLWSVNDESTAKAMVEFYRHLIQSDGNRAEALRQAQLFLLKQEQYEHPYYWAPFVLIGNWL